VRLSRLDLRRRLANGSIPQIAGNGIVALDRIARFPDVRLKAFAFLSLDVLDDEGYVNSDNRSTGAHVETCHHPTVSISDAGPS